jgi:hypothetical protein
LAAAIQNSDYNSFWYVSNQPRGIPDTESKYIVRQILFAFQQGRISVSLPPDAMFVTEGNLDQFRNLKVDIAKQHFREKLVDQIHQLTGVKPVMKKEDNGQYGIYYSA